jgi:hypothetical protein
MLKFPDALRSWASDSFERTLKSEIENLETGSLPLENGISQGGRIDDSNITATILNTSDNSSVIKTKAGIFFTEIVGGCNCNDDPVEINAYCEIIINIDKATAKANIDVLQN